MVLNGDITYKYGGKVIPITCLLFGEVFDGVNKTKLPFLFWGYTQKVELRRI